MAVSQFTLVGVSLSLVRRFLKSRPTRKANVADSLNDRVVDTGLKFRGRNYTVTVKVEGLKPNTLHKVFQTEDTGSRNIPLGRESNIAFFTSNSDGASTFTFEHPEVVEGIEYYLITDALDQPRGDSMESKTLLRRLTSSSTTLGCIRQRNLESRAFDL